MIDYAAVRDFCGAREVDLVIASPSPPFSICLHAEFDGYGDFFSLLARDVEYVELAGGFTVSDIILADDVRALAEVAPKWSRLAGRYSGPAVAFRSADSPSWGVDAANFVIVANQFEWRAGRDWPGAEGR